MTSCHQPTDSSTSGLVTVMCDQTFENIIQQEIDVFEYTYPNASVIPYYVDAKSAIDSMIDGRTSLIVTAQELTQEQSTYDYLSGRMDTITSSNNIQEIAEGQLGLVKADASQVTYITMEDESLIVRTESDLSKLLSGVRTAALSLIGNFDP